MLLTLGRRPLAEYPHGSNRCSSILDFGRIVSIPEFYI